MDSLRKHFPWMTPTEEVWLRAELLRRAAVRFEQAGQWRDAAECWLDLAEPLRAAELYAQHDDLHLAARAALAAGHFGAALRYYRAWAAALPDGDRLNRLRALLGQAACHLLGTQPGGEAGEPRSPGRDTPSFEAGPLAAENLEPLSRLSGRSLYRQARELLATLAQQDGVAAARGWVALAEYGQQLDRVDLVTEGYELALARYEETAATAEKIETGRAYLNFMRAAGDRLLAQHLAERLAGWGAWPAEPAEPSTWQRARDRIERYPFRDGERDVLHFTHAGQWEAWLELAELEEQPDVDDYLRTLAPPEMIYIPPGPFLMGSPDDDPDARDNEKPQHELWLRGYYIDRTPVTNAQFRKFVEAGGYEQEGYWTEAREARHWRDGKYVDFGTERDRPPYWNNDRFNSDEQPVVGVSWYEALAYARWAGKHLPGEAQWEKAAGWDPVARRKRKYPWGDEWDLDKSNSGKKHDRSTAVGHYPEDQSAYGLLDVAGNIWEWCSTRWQDESGRAYAYPYDDQDGRETLTGGDNVGRVTKAASWWNDPDAARRWSRCGFRDWYLPRVRFSDWGYRCVTPHAFFPPILDSGF